MTCFPVVTCMSVDVLDGIAHLLTNLWNSLLARESIVNRRGDALVLDERSLHVGEFLVEGRGETGDVVRGVLGNRVRVTFAVGADFQPVIPGVGDAVDIDPFL